MSSEQSYWLLADQCNKSHITRSRMGQLAKLCNNYDRANSILTEALKTKAPSAYLGKVIANLKDEQAPPAVPIPRSHEPDVVLQARLRGWPVRKSTRSNGDPAWWVAGTLYDRSGVDVGG